MRAMFLALMTLLAACATPPPPDGETFVAPQLGIALPTAASLGYAVAAHQQITARVRGEALVFEAELAIAPEGIDLAALDGFGRRALTLRWADGRLATSVARWMPDRIRPVNILADIALVYWPADVLAAHLRAADAAVEDEGPVRRVRRGGEEVIRIDYDGAGARRFDGRVRLENRAFGYTLEIASVPADD